jgi:uncharacterized protein YjbJ (UPF0337 family)
MEAVEGFREAAPGKLTDDDVTMLSRKKDELIGKLQERYGITREQAKKEADEWAAAANDAAFEADEAARKTVRKP